MALKDWKRIGGISYEGKVVEINYKNKKSGNVLTIFSKGHSVNTKEWGVMADNPIRLIGDFNGKNQALKYAKGYMRDN